MATLRNYIEPIKKKWVYHFIVSPKTSLIDKPEWYLNQTLKWIYEHIDIVEKKVKNDSRTKQLFILHMLELARMRLAKDMSRLVKTIGNDQHSDALLIHTYNEVIQFVKVIRQLLGDKYISLEEKHDLMGVFAQQKLFEKIDDVEWEFSKQNISEITASESKWEPVLEGEFLDYYKIPRCVDRFLLQIRSISERVDCFIQIDCKFRLIDLQLSLFNLFLNFLRKSSEPSSMSGIFFFNQRATDVSHIPRLVHGIKFLTLVLKERCFINPELPLEDALKSKLDKTTMDYKSYLDELLDKTF